MPEEVQPITWESISPEVRQGILFLKRDGRIDALGAIGGHSYDDCPIHRAYGIAAYCIWTELTLGARVLLMEKSWNESIYKAFIRWYDVRDEYFYRAQLRRQREDFLRRYLEALSTS